jgi:hypothetical protein
VGNQDIEGRQDLTLSIEIWHKMMVSVNLVYWRRMTPADCFLSEPVEGMFTHCSEYLKLAKIENDKKYDRGRSDENHRNGYLQSYLAKPPGF